MNETPEPITGKFADRIRSKIQRRDVRLTSAQIDLKKSDIERIILESLGLSNSAQFTWRHDDLYLEGAIVTDEQRVTIFQSEPTEEDPDNI